MEGRGRCGEDCPGLKLAKVKLRRVSLLRTDLPMIPIQAIFGPAILQNVQSPKVIVYIEFRIGGAAVLDTVPLSDLRQATGEAWRVIR